VVSRFTDSAGSGGGDGCFKRKEGEQPIENNQNLSFLATPWSKTGMHTKRYN